MHNVTQQIVGRVLNDYDAALFAYDQRIAELAKENEELKAKLEALTKPEEKPK